MHRTRLFPRVGQGPEVGARVGKGKCAEDSFLFYLVHQNPLSISIFQEIEQFASLSKRFPLFSQIQLWILFSNILGFLDHFLTEVLCDLLLSIIY